MKKTKLFLGLASVAVLAACGNAATTNTEKADITKSNFPSEVTHEGTPISGGVLRSAIVADSPLKGTFNAVYYADAFDGAVVEAFSEGLFEYDENYRIQDGIGSLSYDIENKTITVKVKNDVKWSDGQPFTIDDYIYAFEVIGHPDYNGTRYNANVRNIEGIEEYKAGNASTISGITKVDDYTVTFKLKEISASVVTVGGFWSTPYPKHIFKDIPVAEQAAHDASRVNPVGLGAFRVTSVTAGESVTFEANPYYWKGQPKLEGLVMTVVNSTNAADEFAKGDFDVMSVPNSTAIYDSFKELKNGTLVGQWQNVISYLGFKLGTYDNSTEEVMANPNAKMANKSLRQAMGYALDLDGIAESFYGQLRVRANTLISPTQAIHAGSIEGYTYNPEKAKELLDKAGYKDVDGDGLRENPQGEKLTINFAMMSGGDSDTQAQAYMQYWKEVGLDVQLVNGRTIEFNTFYDQVEQDDPAIDIYMAAWSLSGDPNPNNLWGNTFSNYTRYRSTEHDAVLAKFETTDMFDADKRTAAYEEWQKFSNDEAFALPLNYRTALTIVNKRVKYYNISTGQKSTRLNLHTIEVTADKPAANN